MQLTSSSYIPDGLLATMTPLSEKPRHGVTSKNPALLPGHFLRNSRTPIGLQFRCSEIASGLVEAPNNSNKKYHCDLFGTCYRGPAIITKQAQCQQEALKKNAVALGLDIAGVGAGFLPGGDLVVAGAQAGVSAASAINSSVHGDGWGTAGGVLGVPASFAGYAAKFVGTGAKAIPGVGSAISSFGALNDAYATYSDYQACMARP